jgi:hypothetical protein
VKALSLASLFLFISCSQLNKTGAPASGSSVYTYNDASGRYKHSREFKLAKNRLISRAQLIPYGGSSQKPLEKSITVSQLGTIKKNKQRIKIVRPFAADYSIWLDGKKYSSSIRLDEKRKAMVVNLESPESKWQGKSVITFPSGQYFCFYSQLPECLAHYGFLERSKNKKSAKFNFHVIWEGYPYLQEQYAGVGGQLFTPASIVFEKVDKGEFRYQVEIGGQTLLYSFSKSNELIRIFWIAQGIAILPPGEEISDDE